MQSTQRTCVLLFVLWAATGCSGFSAGMSGSSANSSSSVLALTAANSVVAAGATQATVVSGGKAPYVFSVASGIGSVDANGVFRAPSATGNVSSSSLVTVTDTLGNQASLGLSVSPSVSYSVSASYSPNPAYAGDAITITVSGGPSTNTFSYAVLAGSGTGTLNGAVYTASSLAETAIVRITDSNNVIVDLPITTTVMNIVTAVTLSPLGVHTAGGFGCPADRTQVGSLIDAGGSNYYTLNASGDQIFCQAQTSRSSITSQWVVDAIITDEGQHVAGGASCPAGYVQEGEIEDCHGGYCGGKQSFCVMYGTDLSSNLFLKDLYLTPGGGHLVDGMDCNAGYRARGQIEDCAGGSCSGLQVLCAKN